ncbi:hypothetical protein H0E87_017199 [Populus deltoides]|uniref:Uncharacterized protein n=1 Tax=Populus deltoides TaxID=3696 RepID=A0A8T2XZ94_POPDE|nr:hypothetical protein H0E87_017199 [Populus deltoides]
MSPVFTFIPALEGAITPVCALFYVSAQRVGSIVAYLVIKSVMDKNAEEKYSLGGCMIDGNGEGISPTNAFILEFSCTFIVLFVGVTVAFDKRRCKELGLQMVCGIVAGPMALQFLVSISVTGRAGYAGVGLNPARCLGPSLLKGGRLWDVMMRGDDELDVLQIGFFWKIGFLNKTLEESVEADVLVLKTMATS